MEKVFDDKHLESQFDAAWKKIPKAVTEEVGAKLRIVTDKAELLEDESVIEQISDTPDLNAITIFLDASQFGIYLHAPNLAESDQKAQFVVAHEVAHLWLGHAIDEHNFFVPRSISMDDAFKEEAIQTSQWGFRYAPSKK